MHRHNALLVALMVVTLFGVAGPGFAQSDAGSAAGSGSAVAVTETAPDAAAAPAGDVQGKLDAMVEKLLVGYNAGDSKVFYADFAKSMAAIATADIFKTMYVDKYMKDYGKYVSRTVAQAKCSINPDCPLLRYDAKFEKSDKIDIAVNFIKEGGEFKVMQVQFNVLP